MGIIEIREFCFEVVWRKIDFPKIEMRCRDMIEMRSLLDFDQVFEDADVFGFGNFDSKYPIGVVAED
jgi:hypothetical protein